MKIYLNTIINIAKILGFVFLAALFLKIFFIDAYFVPSGSMEHTLLPGDYIFLNKFIYGAKTPKYLPFISQKIPQIKFPAFREVQIGDVVIFEYPGNIDILENPIPLYYIKRIIACAGDTLCINNGEIKINNRRILMKNYEEVKKETGDNSDIFLRELGYEKFRFGPMRIPKTGDTLIINFNNYLLWKIFIEREGHKTECRGLKIYIDDRESGYYIVNRDYCFALGDNYSSSYDSRFWGFLPVENIIGKAMVIYLSFDKNGVRFNRTGKVIY